MSTQVEGLGLALTMRSFAQQPRHRYRRHPHSRSSGSVKTVCRWVGATGPGIPASEGTSFICGQSTPDTVFLAGIHGPAQTVINDLTATADGPGFLCLDERRAGAPNGEEQFGVQTEAGSTITPRHQDRTPRLDVAHRKCPPSDPWSSGRQAKWQRALIVKMRLVAARSFGKVHG